jgi:4-diphosphocytidyl-2-C-methyl-D-erythritol kinase
MIREIAPAKVNLYLHVGGLRRDRLHDLKSLFFFLDAGDLIEAAPAERLSLEIAGPFAAPLRREPVERNLVFRAARLLQQRAGVAAGARLTLVKHLPIASGVGGGSADAAATLRALVRLWDLSIAASDLRALAFRLGADVPACLEKAPVLVEGAGETIKPAPRLPPLWCCLANPLVPMPTGPIFRAFDAANPAPDAPRHPTLRPLASVADLTRILASSRNDLEPFAIARQSVVQAELTRLAAQPGALAARMSGSGATVFALFASAIAATRAATAMRGLGNWSLSAKALGA